MTAAKRPVVALCSRYPHTQAGGIESVVRSLAPHLQAALPEFEVRPVAAFAALDRLSQTPVAGDVAAAVRLARATADADIVLINGSEYAWPQLLRGASRRRTIVVWHGTREFELRNETRSPSWKIRLLKTAGRVLVGPSVRAAAHVAVGAAVVDEMRAAYGYRGPVTVIPNGAPDDPAPVERSKTVPGKILWTGTSAYKKGLDTAIEAMRIAREHDGALELWIAGLSAPAENQESWIRYLGRCSQAQMRELYATSEAMLATTRYEACSMAILESMAAELPVVYSPAVAWMFDAAKTSGNTRNENPSGNSSATATATATAAGGGGDAAEYARTLAALRADPVLRKNAIAQGRAQLPYFRWDRAAAAYAEIIRARYREVASCLQR